MVPGRGRRTSIVNPSAIKVLTWWDFSSYPKTYPDALSAGAIRVGNAWYALSIATHGSTCCRSGKLGRVCRPDAPTLILATCYAVEAERFEIAPCALVSN